jgi:succinate dehydrogenase/fumarate reductase flavoprotein subunit
VQALELENMLDNLVCMVEAALAREESRGAHYRKDFPQTDHRNWVVSQVLTREAGGVRLRKAPPVITRFEPPNDVQKYGI